MTRAGADKDRKRRLLSSVPGDETRKHRAISPEQRGGLTSGMEDEPERVVRLPTLSFLERRFAWERG